MILVMQCLCMSGSCLYLARDGLVAVSTWQRLLQTFPAVILPNMYCLLCQLVIKVTWQYSFCI